MTVDYNKVAQAFSAHMCQKFGASVHHKEDAFVMKAIAWGMDLGKFVGMTGLASSDQFMTHYTTTVGTDIYMPKMHRDNPMVFIEVLTHECQHVIQFKASGIEFAWLYLKEPEARVKYESDAYAAGIAIQQWFMGVTPWNGADSAVQSLVAGYHLQQQDADLAADILKSHMVSLKNGIVMSGAAREAIDFFTKNYPELKGKS
jgi:hypothetical protein